MKTVFVALTVSIIVALGPAAVFAGGEEESAGAAGFNATGYPVVDEQIQLTFAFSHTGTKDDMDTLEFFWPIEEKTNIDIAWEVLLREGAAEKVNLMLASGDLPDAFYGGVTLTNEKITLNKERFRPLEDLIEAYAPNIRKMMDTEPDTRAVMTAPDGHIYGLASYIATRPNTFNTIWINKTWLDALRLEVPTTLDELHVVLKTFKEGDPNGNGKADEFPITGAGSWKLGGMTGVGTYIFPAFDILFSPQSPRGWHFYHTVVDGEVVFQPTQENYRDAVKYIRKLWADGLIDIEYFSNSWPEFSGRVRNPETMLVGMASAWTVMDGVGVQYLDDYLRIPPFIGPDGTQAHQSQTVDISIYRNRLAMTTANEHPEATIRFVDEAYEPSVALQYAFGALDSGTKMYDDGSMEILPAPEGYTDGEWKHKRALDESLTAGWVSNDFLQNKLRMGDNEAYRKIGDNEFYRPYFKPDRVYPPIFFDDETAEELSFLETDIGNYVESQYAKWVVDGGIDEQWDDYIATLNKMGLERYVEILQREYGKYIK